MRDRPRRRLALLGVGLALVGCAAEGPHDDPHERPDGAGAGTGGSAADAGAADGAPLVGLPGSELRCQELGDGCVCSEPLDTDVLVRVGDAWKNPADSTTRECSMVASLPGSALERNADDLFGTDDPVALAALPPGATARFFVRAAEGHVGLWNTGQGSIGDRFLARAAARWYLYHSPDYEFAEEGDCRNSKLAQFTSALLDKSFGDVHMYNFLDWSPARDCCMTGPGPDRVAKADWRGRWWRIEVVFTHREGPGLNVVVYLKDVTDDLPELTVVDLTYGPTYASDGALQWMPSELLTPPARQDMIISNGHRDANGGACRGWMGMSHYLLAGWERDEGQRIGPAVEMEGP